MTNPLNPNFKQGVGRLATDRYDFQTHINGTGFNHTAGMIQLSPAITIQSATFTDVQTLLGFLSGTIVIPTVPNATKTSVGVIQLGGDLNGLNSTALNPQLSSLQGTLLSINGGSLAANQVLQWNGSAWVNAAIVPATTLLLGTIQLSTAASPSTGDIGNTATNPKVIGIQGVPISTTTPTTNQVLAFNGTQWAPASASGTPLATASTQGTIRLAGDLAGSGSSATTPRVGSINGATVPVGSGLTTNNVLLVSGATALSYGFVADANIAPAAAIQGSKVTPNFGTQALTAGTSSLGTLTAGTSTSVNSLTGSLAVTTRSISANLTVDSISTDYVIFVNTSTPIQITLPAPTNGRRLIIKDSTGGAAGNNITVVRHAAENIEGLAASKVLQTNWGSWTFVSDGTNWFMI